LPGQFLVRTGIIPALSSFSSPDRKRVLVEASAAIAFFVSGASALIFETLWFEQASLVFGNDIWASSAVLSAFMLGMAGGQLGAVRFSGRFEGLRAFAILEIIAGISGVALLFALGIMEAHFAPLASGFFEDPAPLNFARVLFALVLMLVPSAAMGASLPVLTGALTRGAARYGRVLGVLYGANTAGAVLGVVATELYLVPAFGVRTTGFVAAGAELAVAAVAFFLSSRSQPAEPSVNAPANVEPIQNRIPWLAGAFLAGLSLLALEVVWVRILTLFIDDTSSAFAAILAVVLLGIALGGFAGGVWLGKSNRAVEQTARVAYLCGFAGLAGYAAYPAALARYYVPEAPQWRVAAIACPLVLPVALGSGILFTLVGSGLHRSVHSGVGATAGVATFNTLGAGLGSLLAGFVLLPSLGMDRALFLLLALYGIIGFVVSWRAGSRRLARYGELGAFAALMAFYPFGKIQSSLVGTSAARWIRGTGHVVGVREAKAGTLIHIRHQVESVHLCDQIVTNAYSMTSNDFLARRYMKFFVYLPVALEPRVSKVLVLGYGMGNTVKALVDTKETTRIDVVDVSNEMLEMSRAVVPAQAPHPLDDPRVRVHIGDARYFLRSTKEEYDLITGEPPPPVMARVSSLYSEEYFQLVRDRLAPGGMVTYWLPTMNLGGPAVRSLIRGFCNAFFDCSLWNGAKENFVLAGSQGSVANTSDERFVAQWRDPVVAGELRDVGFESPGQLGASFVGGAEYLKELTSDAAPLSDDFPKRIVEKGTDERKALVTQWRDTSAARERFRNSAFVLESFPPNARKQTLANFENQRLLNDLVFPGATRARSVTILDQVLRSTRLRLPALLMLGSDSDVQRGLASLPPAEQHRQPLLRHGAAGALAARNPGAALDFLREMPDSAMPLAGLRSYVEAAAREQQTPSLE
jgi:spermidine synthase